MSPDTFIDPQLTGPDLLVLKNLLADVDHKTVPAPRESTNGKFNGHIQNSAGEPKANGHLVEKTRSSDGSLSHNLTPDRTTIEILEALNDSKSNNFEPTVFMFWDLKDINEAKKAFLAPYVHWAQKIVRHPTDVVMLNHLFIYFTTSLPSAIYLYYNFSYLHGFAHWLMQSWYVGSYTLMRHQHIHQGGILAKKAPINWFDTAFPYITDPLHGHTWNSYFYHHVKHHHVEGNGPDDLSSTIRYQRDDLLNFLHYVGRFFFLIWIDLPMYFVRKSKYSQAFKAAFWEIGTLVSIVLLARWDFKPTLFVFILPLLVIRVGLMVGNWGQHALVDEIEPDSDFRSSITLIDVPSNRFCFNDGYHTSHHLNPRRHWRDHPVAFLKQKEKYAAEQALVFRNIDYIMITIRLLKKDYEYLAKCLVPIGDQIDMTMKEREEMLRSKTRAFTDEEVKAKFNVQKNA